MRQPLDSYDEMPRAMRAYLKNYGWHFNSKACDYAVSLMQRQDPSTGKEKPVEAISKEQYDEMLNRAGVKPQNDTLCDGLYVANKCKASYLKRSVPDETHMAMFVRDTLDDIDAADGNVMRQWYASMVGAGHPVDWEELL